MQPIQYTNAKYLIFNYVVGTICAVARRINTFIIHTSSFYGIVNKFVIYKITHFKHLMKSRKQADRVV